MIVWLAWLAWVGSAFVAVSILFDDRRALRVVNLVAAAVMLVVALALGSAPMVLLNATMVAAALRQVARTRARTVAL